jgi:hypothetical protein
MAGKIAPLGRDLDMGAIGKKPAMVSATGN